MHNIYFFYLTEVLRRVFDLASIDLHNMGIVVVSYTIKVIKVKWFHYVRNSCFLPFMDIGNISYIWIF